MFDKLPPKILVLEPDDTLNSHLCNAIERSWLDVIRTKTIDDALRMCKTNSIDLLVLSTGIETSALDLLTQIQNATNRNISAIFMLEQGHDRSNFLYDKSVIEFIKKPFSSADLVDMVRSMLRKLRPAFQEKILKYKDIKMDLATFKVFRGAREVHLGPTEFKILQMLVLKPGVIFSRKEIIDYVWGASKEISDRTIDVHINRIRYLIKSHEQDYIIRTVRAAGYSIN